MQRSIKNNLVAICAAFVAALSWSPSVSAQDLEFQFPEMEEIYDPSFLIAPDGFEWVDSLIYVPVPAVDTAYVGKNIFDVDVRQSRQMAGSMIQYLFSNPSRVISGFRVRIFFDNKQSAKVESEKTLEKFIENYRDVPAYRTYANPYFKVTVGDCRTKSEAMALLGRIKADFPSAFVVKENICFPVLDPEHTHELDTVQVLRPLPLPDVEPVL